MHWLKSIINITLEFKNHALENWGFKASSDTGHLTSSGKKSDTKVKTTWKYMKKGEYK